MKRALTLALAGLLAGPAWSQARPPTMTVEDIIIRKAPNTAAASGTLSRMLGERITASQTIANKLPGVALPEKVGNALKDIAEFYSYGGKADGCGLCSTHPLSSITEVNGINTAGYTLAQWQNFYSVCTDAKGNNPVTALDNEVDEIAIQCVINKKTQDGIVWLPSGWMYQSKPIVSGQFALDVRGAGGGYASRLVQTKAGQDGWRHGLADGPFPGPQNYGARFSIYNMQLGCAGPGNEQNPMICGTAIRANFANNTAGFRLTDVGIGGQGNQTFNHWYNGIQCNNCSLTEISRVGVGGINTGGGKGRLIDTGTGIAFTGSEAVQFTLRDVTTNGWNIAVSTWSGGHNLSDLEGFVFDNWQANQVMYGLVNQNQVGDGYRSPQYVITNSQFNVCRQWLYLAQVEEVFINNNLVYTCGSGSQTGGTADYDQYLGTVTGSAASGSTTLTLTTPAPAGLVAGAPIYGPFIGANNKVASVSGSTVTLTKPVNGTITSRDISYGRGSPGYDGEEFIVMTSVSNATMRDNVVRAGRTGNITTFARFLNTINVTLDNNRVSTVFNQSIASGYWNNVNNTNLVETNTVFEGMPGWFDPVANPLDGADRGNRLEAYYRRFNASVLSDKSVQLPGSFAGTLDANRLVNITLPPVFTATPGMIQITNGDVGANAGFCGVNMGATNAGQIGVSCPTATPSGPIRLNYNAVGTR